MGSQEGDSARRRWPEGSTLEVDDLMDELRTRAGAARRSHEQIESLLDAVVAITADLELSDVLGRIVRSACTLVNAKYGALGVLAPDGDHLMEFITHGVSTQEREAIGDPPQGHGILGLLITDPRARRLVDISAHPDSYGFPPNHPQMRSFLGTPIRIRDEVFGNLYLTERQGEPQFTDEDEAMLVALAAAAGVAIDNARMYERAQEQRHLAQAVSELTRSLLESDGEDLALSRMAEHVCRLTGAELCLVALQDDHKRRRVRAVADARDREAVRSAGHRLDLAAPEWFEILDVGEELLVLPGAAPGATASVLSQIAVLGELERAGPLAVVPVRAGVGELGHLLVMWAADDEDRAGTSMLRLSAFAQQAGLGLMAARAQHDRARLALLSDRDRIGRDMHDHVIQRIFATGLSLQAVEKLAVHPLVQSRLTEAVDSLDATIKVIRSTIFELHTMASPGVGETLVREVVDSFTASLGFDASLEVVGDLIGLEDALLADLVAVVRECLSNVARHAGARCAGVEVRRANDSLGVVVCDDGRGVPDGGRRSGLANLQHRAESRSGTFELVALEPHGTRVVWTVPTPP